MAPLSDPLLSSSYLMAGAQAMDRIRMFFTVLFTVIFRDVREIFNWDDLGKEIIRIAFPAAAALAADPLASLVDTAFIGRLGTNEVAAVGVAIVVFNQASRLLIFPLVSVTTSFVAEDVADSERVADPELEHWDSVVIQTNIPIIDSGRETIGTHIFTNEQQTNFEPKHLPSASSALLIGGSLGLLQAGILIIGETTFLKLMGLNSDSPMMTPASQYLTLRSLGAPAVLLSLSMQGIFRGLKDTYSPLYAIVAGNVLNIVLDPVFMFTFHLGVRGAAISHIISQYLISMIMLWKLMRRVDLLPRSIKDLQLCRFLKIGILSLAKVIAVTSCVTMATSRVARQGTVPMAAFQICLQVWMTLSLLADGLAVAGQAILASEFARRNVTRAIAAASRILQLTFAMGLALSALVGIGLQLWSIIFINDVNVLQFIHLAIPFVSIGQVINPLAFVFDGINTGASDFAYSAYSMILVGIVSLVFIFILSSSHGFLGIWIALTIFMSLRMLAGFWRIGTANGPWTFLRDLL